MLEFIGIPYIGNDSPGHYNGKNRGGDSATIAAATDAAAGHTVPQLRVMRCCTVTAASWMEACIQTVKGLGAGSAAESLHNMPAGVCLEKGMYYRCTVSCSNPLGTSGSRPRGSDRTGTGTYKAHKTGYPVTGHSAAMATPRHRTPQHLMLRQPVTRSRLRPWRVSKQDTQTFVQYRRRKQHPQYSGCRPRSPRLRCAHECLGTPPHPARLWQL